MKSLYRCLAATLCLALPTLALAQAPTQPCPGRTMNPVTDICWSCIFPLSIGSSTVAKMGQEDIENTGSPICLCGPPPPWGKLGISIGFWEPARQVDVVRTPWCFPSLGGMTMNGASAPVAAVGAGLKGRRASNNSFYQAHWYINPVLYWLEVLSETSCLEQRGFDLAYVTELDAAWNDDELSAILSPEAILFASPAAQAACAGDCAAATTGFPIAAMQWCAGCQGGMYPLNGHVQAHVSGVQASSLILQRFAMKLHREFLAFAGNGIPGWCGMYPMPILDRRIYKYSMLYPSTQGRGADGRCCQPLGRTTALWSAGKEYPIDGEDFVYMLYRKRNCCERLVGAQR
ncbi:conjugal transfer pilus assembly protein TraU [Pseudoduganella lurida]|uniref:Conjugal transfer pilus assembly protein TraU n=1 Tax=Pseudoduganella lurida TaxID=1036180 RepID=A0A562RLG4_9BURK|nr:conjugal transfer pilus assembly protein TraU [Pseudoduganella lurida]TWI69296.1 conjugal transfer pilus assembly protein TraU [Pseudoduganella lurida]